MTYQRRSSSTPSRMVPSRPDPLPVPLLLVLLGEPPSLAAWVMTVSSYSGVFMGASSSNGVQQASPGKWSGVARLYDMRCRRSRLQTGLRVTDLLTYGLTVLYRN